jgi:Flp pilus assembly protein TadD
MTAAAAAVLLAAALAPAASTEQRFAFATLENGASIGFALMRSEERAPAGAIGEAALTRSNTVSRVLWDRTSGAYFGYRVEVQRREGLRPFRVSFKALDRASVERELGRRGDCAGCPPPLPLGTGPQFPPAEEVAEGEALTLELLANPETGERIFDVVKLSERPVTKEAMEAAAARAREGQQAARRADALGARGRFADAADEYRKALAIQPHDAVVHNKLGICYQYLQKDELARRQYQRALELKPSYAQVWNNLGTLEQSRSRFKQAVRAYKRSIALNPAHAMAWKNLGNAYLSLGQVREGFEAYQEAFRLDPAILERASTSVPATGIDDATLNYTLAKLLAQNGHTDRAIELLRRAREAGFRDFARVEADPDFRAVVADARFRELASPR